MLGDALLVKPVTVSLADGGCRTEVFLPEGGWYNLFTKEYCTGGTTVTLETPLGRFPVLVRAGSILPLSGGAVCTAGFFSPPRRSRRRSSGDTAKRTGTSTSVSARISPARTAPVNCMTTPGTAWNTFRANISGSPCTGTTGTGSSRSEKRKEACPYQPASRSAWFFPTGPNPSGQSVSPANLSSCHFSNVSPIVRH